LSGAALKGTQRYAQDVASQEYSNAFNRYMANRASKLGALGGLVSTGAGAAQGLAGAAGQFGQYGGQTLADIGNAEAAGVIGPASAYANVLGGLGNLGMSYAMLNSLNASPGASGRGTATPTLGGTIGGAKKGMTSPMLVPGVRTTSYTRQAPNLMLGTGGPFV
jgi:hypothetical protein